jgi:uncharacterized protein YdaU (DUF1376 family)
MSSIPVMPVYVPDFLADIKAFGLRLDEIGAYVTLLFATWKRREAIPDDEREIAAILGCTRYRWREKLRPRLAPFFDFSSGTLRNNRIEQVLSEVEEKRETARENGKRGGRPRLVVVPEEKNPGVSGEEPRNEPNPSTSPSHEGKNASPLPQPESDTSTPLSAGGLEKIEEVRSGFSGSGGRWVSQQSRDEFATAKCVELLPGNDIGAKWVIAMAAEDVNDPKHEEACRAMRKAAKAGGIGWVSPARRRAAAGGRAV